MTRYSLVKLLSEIQEELNLFFMFTRGIMLCMRNKGAELNDRKLLRWASCKHINYFFIKHTL